MTAAPLFKDLHKLVAQQQQDKARNDLYDRLINKPFWIWNKQEHKQEDIRTNGEDIHCTSIINNAAHAERSH